MPLTDKSIRNLKPRDTLYRVADAGGLAIEVTPNGTKLWRLRYRVDGVAKMIALSKEPYPATSLVRARELRDEQRKLVLRGIDPSAERKREKLVGTLAAANTLQAVANEWIDTRSGAWVEDHTRKVRGWLSQHVYPVLGHEVMAGIDAPQLHAMLKRIEARGTLNTAERVRQTLSAVWRYAIATGRASHDYAADLRGTLTKASAKNFATIVEPKAIGELLRTIEGYQGDRTTLAALRLAPMLFQRPGELRGMRWSEVDLDAATWAIPPSRQKVRRKTKEDPRAPSHVVPLAPRAVEILREQHKFSSSSEFVFPGVRDRRRPMSENTINAALRRLGYDKTQMTGHGFRHMASTMLNELGWNPDAIERQLAHGDKDEIRATYNRAAYLDERRRMMLAWADHLDALRAGAEVVPLRKSA